MTEKADDEESISDSNYQVSYFAFFMIWKFKFLFPTLDSAILHTVVVQKASLK